MYKVKDYYFNKAKSEKYLARSVYKLKEIQENLKIIKPHHIVLDLGCAPGSWLQYIAPLFSNNKGAALGVDLTQVSFSHPRIKTVVDDVFLLGQEKYKYYLKELAPEFSHFNVILSDMAPKTSGIKHVDQAKSFYLAKKVLDIANESLALDGHVIIKVFGQKEVEDLYAQMKTMFKTVKYVRPQSIRSASKELYLVGLFKG
jgi:23S rRNA (uridine2552-2'-O)-methyltransferase